MKHLRNIQEGFMGMSSYGQSDSSADLVISICKSVYKKLLKSLNEENNEFNTTGSVNVALVLKTGILDDLLKLPESKNFNFNLIFKSSYDRISKQILNTKDKSQIEELESLKNVVKKYLG